MSSDIPPATLAEFTLVPGGSDAYDVSLVDGFNIPLTIVPSLQSCTQPACASNINTLCPPLLRTAITQNGVNLACLSPCNAGFGQEIYGNRACCSGAYNDPTLCAICGVDYYSLYKDNCNTSYAYAYDEKSNTALWYCPANSGSYSDYSIVFCPNGTDYVGSTDASTESVDATATCSNMATAFSTTFSVGPSPTNTASFGGLSVVATAATGLDGAAALQLSTTATTTTGAATGSATATTTAGSSSQTGGIVTQFWSEYYVTVGDSVTATTAGSTTATATDSISTEEDVSTLTTSYSGSSAALAFETAASSERQHCQGGQYLVGMPQGHRKRSKFARDGAAH